jgi:hypothetical protein
MERDMKNEIDKAIPNELELQPTESEPPEITRGQNSITFPVSNVPLAETLLPEAPYKQAVEYYLYGPYNPGTVESCTRKKQTLVVASYHPLINALHLAFAEHRPFVISPDHIWLLICQGFANHVNVHAEELRHQFVKHTDKEKLKVIRNKFIKGNPDNKWESVFSSFERKINKKLTAHQNILIAEFTTTGQVEKIAQQICLMDAMRSYFDYSVLSFCGIPSVTLEGTVEDWQLISEKMQAFRQFGLDDWINALTPIVEQFTQAANGQIDPEFWRSMYKFKEASGGDKVTGWIINFFPYLKKDKLTAVIDQNLVYEATYVVNPYILNPPHSRHDGLTANQFPSGLSIVPFKWEYHLLITFPMQFIAGFVGIAQNPDTKALRPEIGWAIRDEPQKS